MINARLDSVQRSVTIPKICVDMGLTGFMSEKVDMNVNKTENECFIKHSK